MAASSRSVKMGIWGMKSVQRETFPMSVHIKMLHFTDILKLFKSLLKA